MTGDISSVVLFIEEKCHREAGLEVQASILYNAYKSWCFTNNYKPYSLRNFRHEMERQNCHCKQKLAYRVFEGVELMAMEVVAA